MRRFNLKTFPGKPPKRNRGGYEGCMNSQSKVAGYLENMRRGRAVKGQDLYFIFGSEL